MKINDLGREILILKEQIGNLTAEVDNLRDWQNQQNGTLQKLAEKVDRIQWYLTTLLGGLAVSLFLQILSLLRK